MNELDATSMSDVDDANAVDGLANAAAAIRAADAAMVILLLLAHCEIVDGVGEELSPFLLLLQFWLVDDNEDDDDDDCDQREWQNEDCDEG